MTHALLSRALTGMALCTGSACAFAHDGHGLAGTHWHPTDTAGFAVVALLAGLALWLGRDR